MLTVLARLRNSASNPKFSVLEGAVLWEYHKLSTSIKKVCRRTPPHPPRLLVLRPVQLLTYASCPACSLWQFNDMKRDPVQPHDQLLAVFRGLEKKMGLVLTLVRAPLLLPWDDA